MGRPAIRIPSGLRLLAVSVPVLVHVTVTETVLKPVVTPVTVIEDDVLAPPNPDESRHA